MTQPCFKQHPLISFTQQFSEINAVIYFTDEKLKHKEAV